jgi:hypothetical protein
VFGVRYIPVVVTALLLTDLAIGFHSTIIFTTGSVILIGLFSEYFNKSITYRLSGALVGTLIFFLITNFGVWLNGTYGYNLIGLLNCYIAALPFFGYSMTSTILFSVLIETIYNFYQKKFINILK